jgi:hypothetical protein
VTEIDFGTRVPPVVFRAHVESISVTIQLSRC